jgi:hypothetical protein
MRALVVYESLFGNTAEIANGIAEGLRARWLQVAIHPVTQVTPQETAGADLLVVGGPTHAHGMSRAPTRTAGAADKANTYPEPTVESGLREWLDELPGTGDRTAAAFDTRLNKSILLTGSAAKGIAKRLRRRGFQPLAGPESFFVTTDNELEPGESERARRWGIELAERVAVRTTP